MGCAACGATGENVECLTYPTGANTAVCCVLSCVLSPAPPAGLEREHRRAAWLPGLGWGCTASPQPLMGSDPAGVGPVSAGELQAPAVPASGQALAAEEHVRSPPAPALGPVPPLPGEP